MPEGSKDHQNVLFENKCYKKVLKHIQITMLKQNSKWINLSIQLISYTYSRDVDNNVDFFL